MSSRIPPLLIIVGQTGSGKTDLAIDLAKRLNGEIINADSWSIRKSLDVGTAKPTIKERKEVEHHLLDIAEPDEDFNAAEYKNLAFNAIKDISSRGKLAIMVGGTGLYVDSVVYDYSFVATADKDLRKKMDKLPLSELLDITKKQNLDTSQIDIRNKRRVIRLIESNGEKPKKRKMRDNTLIIGIKIPNQDLKLRIIKRLDLMIERGLILEVAGLLKKHTWDDEILKGVGYRQWRGYFDGTQTLDETKLQIINATMNLAKRQNTWFKRNNSIHWIDQSVKLDDTVDLISTYLSI